MCETGLSFAEGTTPNGMMPGEWLCTTATTSGRAR